MSSIVAIIPARYASTRLPGKPLVDIGGLPMILHVIERAREAPSVNRVIVATDDQRIYDVVESAGYEALIDSGKPSNWYRPARRGCLRTRGRCHCQSSGR